jgi:hypothetical protein
MNVCRCGGELQVFQHLRQFSKCLQSEEGLSQDNKQFILTVNTIIII